MIQKFKLPELPFEKNSLEPWMSNETLEFHHGKHHKTYVDKTNELIAGTEFENSSLEEIIRFAEGPLLNNASQAWNHAFFWNCLAPNQGELSSELRSALERDFGSTDAFLEKFKKTGTEHFGSGYAWLVQDPATGKLSVESSTNAENPIRRGKKPILTCDLWEHSYYIDYRNERPRYLEGFFNLIHWDFMAQNLSNNWKAAA